MKKLFLCSISFLCLGLVLASLFVYPKLFVDLYAQDGATVSVPVFSVDKYKADGWYEMPVTTIYAPDGRSEVVYAADVEEYQSAGWYQVPVTTVYAPDGRSEVVAETDMEAKIKSGWYPEPVARMNKGGEEQFVLLSETDKYRRDGWLMKEYCFGLSELYEQLKQYIQNRQGSFGIYIKNLDTDESLVLNDGKYHSASIIKLFQMAAIYDEIEKGNLKKNQELQDYLNLLITVSDNFSSNQLVSIIGHGNYYNGFETENQYIKSIGCLNTHHLSLFMDEGYFVAYGGNRVSPYDCGSILEQIYRRTLVSPKSSDEMLSLLKRQTRRNKIPYDLPEGTVCANKTGETSTIESDVGIVYSPACDYIICVLTNDAPTGIEDIRRISHMTYEYFNK